MVWKVFRSNALTLTELVIALSIVGIIMLGVASSDYAIRNQGIKASTAAQAALNAQGIIQHIMSNAINAQGSASSVGLTISGSDFCIRTDTTTPKWQCYHPITSGPDTHLYYCADKVNSAQNDASEQCTAADTQLGKINTITPLFALDNTTGTAHMVFSVNVVVPDISSAGNQRSFTASISPPAYSL